MGKVTCAVIACSNSTYRLNRWKTQYCSIHECVHDKEQCNCDPPFTLHPFPNVKKNYEELQCWINHIKRTEPVNRNVVHRIGGKNVVVKHKKGDKWSPTSYDRVCSIHFIDGKPTAEHPTPVLHMGHDSFVEKKKRKPPKHRSPIKPKRLKASVELHNEDANVESLLNKSDTDTASETMICPSHYDSEKEIEVESKSTCEECVLKKAKIRELEQKIKALEKLLKKERSERIAEDKRRKVNEILYNCLKSDKQVKFYTGIPTVKHFTLLYSYVYDKVKDMTYWRGQRNTVVNKTRKFKVVSPKKGGGKRLLTVKAELILILMKLRLDILNHDLADRFAVSEATVSSIFNTYVKVLPQILKFLIYWPDKDCVRNNLPTAFQKLYPRTRVIIDCSEFFLDTPRDLMLQAQVYSDYKHHCTAKALIGITPRGSISFVSECWGGRTSDRHITVESGILKNIDPTDQWMADRGFLVASEVLQRGGELIVPPAAKGHQQMISADVKKTKDIANLRIHVERSIQRIKCFRFLKHQIPLTYINMLDNILVIVCSLVNLQGALVK